MLKFFSGFFTCLAFLYFGISWAFSDGYIQTRSCVFDAGMIDYVIFVNPHKTPKAGDSNGSVSYAKNQVTGGIVEVYASKFIDGTIEIRWDINSGVAHKEFRNHGGGLESQEIGFCGFPTSI